MAAYAVSPVDLIPDFIPVLGLLDDLILIPLGLALVIRMVPQQVLASAREQAARATEQPTSRGMAVVIVTIWIIVLGALAWWGYGTMRLHE